MDDRSVAEQRRRRRWWVYDRPLVTDWMFAWAVAISVAGTAWPYVFPPAQRAATVVNLTVSFLWAFVGTSVVLGCIREYVRGRREGRPARDDRRVADFLAERFGMR